MYWLRSRRERAVAEERGYEGGRRSGIANRFEAEWER
ncbi:hypothetical protein ACQJBY_054469 [Aegilops geniculata]